MRKLSLVIAGILGAGSPLISQAATLGQAQVQSYLSEPLEVRVPLMRSSDEPLDEITVQLAPPSFYREAGVPLANLGSNLTFAIRSEHGQEYVLIGSKRPIRDPILSILLQVESPQGRMIRSYNLLLDPPTVASSAPDKTPASATQPTPTRTAAAPKPPASSAWQRVKPAGDVDLDATRKVERGDTLYEIARDYVGEGEDVRPMMQAIIDANPQAFANGNGNAMMAGAELKVPTRSAGGAKTEDKAAADTETETIQRLPALELLSPAEKSDSTAARGFGELSRDNPLRAISGPGTTRPQPMDRESALEQEELESVKAENEALTEQLRELRDQIDSVKVGVDDRDAQIAELKEVVERSRQEAQAAEAAQASFWVQWGKYLTGGLGLLVLGLLIALGLRRRGDNAPAVPMPATADAAHPSPVDEPVIHRTADDSDAPTTSAAGVGVAAGMAAASASGESEAAEEDAAGSAADDPMNPEMALEEAHVLESFNLTHQALELLRDSLAEHPGHTGLQAGIARLSGEEGESESPAEEPTDMGPTDDSVETGLEPSESVAGEPAVEETADTAEEAPTAPKQDEVAGEISWDEDFDDMLATPESDAERERAADESLMEFDDSFALETPAGERESVESETGEPSRDEDASLDIPDNETPAASVEGTEVADEPEPMDLDLSGYEPAGDTEAEKSAPNEHDDTGLELDMTPGEQAPAEEPSGENAKDAGSDADVDTRVSLAEAFLDVGDRESFDMLESELREEGATAALERLDELKARHEGNG